MLGFRSWSQVSWRRRLSVLPQLFMTECATPREGSSACQFGRCPSLCLMICQSLHKSPERTAWSCSSVSGGLCGGRARKRQRKFNYNLKDKQQQGNFQVSLQACLLSWSLKWPSSFKRFWVFCKAFRTDLSVCLFVFWPLHVPRGRGMGMNLKNALSWTLHLSLEKHKILCSNLFSIQERQVLPSSLFFIWENISDEWLGILK